MQRDAYRGSVGRKTRTRVELKPRLGEEKKQRRKSEIPRQRSQETDLSAWKDMQQRTRKEGRLTAGR